jgi:hypothetical protein
VGWREEGEGIQVLGSQRGRGPVDGARILISRGGVSWRHGKEGKGAAVS